MKINLHHRPAYALAEVELASGETIVAEGGAMVSKDTHVALETSAGKPGGGLMSGLLSGLKRMVAGESFFQNRLTAQGRPGRVTLAPAHVGDIAHYTLQGGGLLIQSKSYLASDPNVNVDASWGGARSFFGGEGLIMLKATGSGPVLFNSFGGIKEIQVNGKFTVDTGHIVAFEDSLTYSVSRFGGGWKAFIFGGEGLVCSFTGSGRLWIQTRNPQGFGTAIGPKLPMIES